MICGGKIRGVATGLGRESSSKTSSTGTSNRESDGARTSDLRLSEKFAIRKQLRAAAKASPFGVCADALQPRYLSG